MLNKQDTRYLLIDEVWPDKYFDFDLRSKSDEIMQELGKLRNDGSYEKWIMETGDDKNQENKIAFLQGILILFDMLIYGKTLGKEAALRVLKKQGYKYTTREQVQKALNNRLFDREMEAEKAKGEKSKQKELTFERLCIPIERYFKKDLDRDITVIKFVEWENEMKESVAKQSA